MTKYLQNKIAGSRITLPVACLYSFVVWLASGVIQEKWWLQLSCFAFTTYLMAILNSKNSLIRVYSSLISVFFMVFTCCNCLLFPSIREAVSILFLVLCYFILFSSYQDKTATGLTLYGFAALGAATMSNVHLLYYVPLFWLFMRYNLLSLSWRTWMASLLGLLTPYWFMLAWLFYTHRHEFDFSLLISHFGDLSAVTLSDFAIDDLQRLLTLVVVIILGIVGGIHFIMKHYEDKFRVRQLYYSFIYLALYTLALMFVIPSQFDILLRILIIAVSPLIGHFFALTKTKVSNIFFLVTAGVILILTLFNLWSSSSIF